MKGHLSVGYIDHSYLQAAEFAHCVRNIIDTITLFNNLGFVTHPISFVPHSTTCLLGVCAALYSDETLPHT